MHSPKSILGVEGLCGREGAVGIAIITAIKHQNSLLKLSLRIIYVYSRVLFCVFLFYVSQVPVIAEGLGALY